MRRTPISILKSHNLRITDCRVDVIEFFMDSKSALSLVDLANQFPKYDKVTLYRTINSFHDSGVLHKIPSESGTISYGLCHYAQTSTHHYDNHIHFKCHICGQTECLEDREVPEVSVPKGYTMKKVNLIVEGVCADCA